MPHQRAADQRRYQEPFAVSPLTVVIALLYFGVQVVVKLTRPPPPPGFAFRSAAYQFGFEWGAFIYPPIVALIIAVIGYALVRPFASRAGKAANVLFCLPFVAVLTLQTLAWCGVDVRSWFVSGTGSTASAASATQPPRTGTAQPAAVLPASPPIATGPRTSPQTEPPLPNEGPASAPSSPPAMTTPPQPDAPKAPATPADKPWNANPAKRAPADVAASLAEEGHPARTALLTLASELQTSIDEALAVGVRLDDLNKRPIPSTKPALMDRIKPADDLVLKAKALATRLRDVTNEASSRLEAAGQDARTCMILSTRFSRGTESFERAVAADGIARAAEASADFFRLLHDNAGKWTVNAQGDITVKDQSLKSKLFFARSSFDHQKDRLGDDLRSLAAGQPLPDPKAKPK